MTTSTASTTTATTAKPWHGHPEIIVIRNSRRAPADSGGKKKVKNRGFSHVRNMTVQRFHVAQHRVQLGVAGEVLLRHHQPHVLQDKPSQVSWGAGGR